MFQVLVNGQSALKGEILARIDKLEQKMDKKFEEVDKRFGKVDKRFDTLESNLTKRIDRIGKQVAFLEDDAPTREEHDKLVRRVTKIEQKIASV